MKFLAVFAAILALSAAAPRSTWTLPEISAALENPTTNPALIPYLEAALNEIMAALWSGQQVGAVALPLPAEISPAPAVVEEAPAAPVAASPLVQIIVNVNQQSADAVAPTPVPSPAAVPEIVPTPVAVVDSINPTPVVVVDETIVPTPVVVVEEPAEEVIPAPPTIDVNPAPVDVVEPVDVNPIDVIAVAAPEVNPVDIMNPIPVNPAAVGDIWV